jgi:hypothetical protein
METVWHPCTRLRRHAALLLAMLLSACSNGEAFTAADHTRCRELGFDPGNADYGVCVVELRKQRTGLTELQLRD